MRYRPWRAGTKSCAIITAPGAICALILLLACAVAPQAGGEEMLVRSQQEYRRAVERAQPGDAIVLANGTWRDFEILLTGEGLPDAPITLTAETKGQVLITGSSNLRLAGKHLVVSGLVFKDGHTPTNTVIAFRRTRGDLAHHSRVTETVIDHFNNPERFETDFWVMMYGRHNRFDHNHLEGKNNAGVTLAVRLDSEDSRQNHHRIDHNYFGPRPVLGSNGGETLRIGTSRYSLSDSLTVVEYNYFDRCNGEVEIISSKSGGNIFRGNLFFESQGGLTLRHGNGNVVENNVFLGNRAPNTGGIRVINKGQRVRNNYLHGLTGRRFGGALVVMNGVPDSPINRYHQVDDAVIANNSVIESDHIELAAGSDDERSAAPVNSVFRSNLIFNQDGRNIIAAHDDLGGIDFEDNVTRSEAPAPLAEGFFRFDFALKPGANGLLRPAPGELEGRDAERVASAGADADADLQVLQRRDAGPSWYPRPESSGRFDFGATLEVAPGLDTLSEAVNMAGAGDIIRLRPGSYLVTRVIVVRQPLTLRADAGSAEIAFERSTLFEIADGGSLKLQGLTISGKAAPDVAGNAVIRTGHSAMRNNYVLIVEDSAVEDMDSNHSFHFLAPAKHTFADRISIADSRFRNITGHVLALNRETDDIGIYNAERISIVRSRFAEIGGAIADIYRGGTDESTFGPRFELRSSSVESAGQSARNRTAASIVLHGVQVADIFDNRFSGSRPVRVIHTSGEPITRIGRNRFEATPPPIIAGMDAL